MVTVVTCVVVTMVTCSGDSGDMCSGSVVVTLPFPPNALSSDSIGTECLTSSILHEGLQCVSSASQDPSSQEDSPHQTSEALGPHRWLE